MGVVALESGSLSERLRAHVGVLELPRLAQDLRRAVHPLVHLRGRRDGPLPPDRVPACLLHRVPRRQVQERAPPVRSSRRSSPRTSSARSPGRRSSPTRARSSTSSSPSGSFADDGRLLDTPASVIAGLTYNFLPFMILPIYASLEQHRQAADRGVEGPLRQRAHVVPQCDASALRARRDRRHAPHLHSRRSATTSTPISSAAPARR